MTSDPAHPPNTRLADGTMVHICQLMECWNCKHAWVECSTDQEPPCPRCGERNAV